MATSSESLDDHVHRLNRESALIEAETRKLRAEAGRMWAEQSKSQAKQDWLGKLFDRSPGYVVLVGVAMAIAIVSLGALPVILFKL